MSFLISATWSGSRPTLGSSRISTCGSFSRQAERQTRWRNPFESWPRMRPRDSFSPHASSARWIARARSFGATRFIVARYSRYSPTRSSP